ncbi:MFS transporter [Gordonia sp. HY285]|uniref:MFS transporter n=1 Tax=Gordonia liuliyuniae TaxID=2911517 RepID=UPI001F029CF0|nr:MFS transporter [Gordonia liuliyuniae]MCF8609271.1 MFS transporter [Gordonia liuliyuniae]
MSTPPVSTLKGGVVGTLVVLVFAEVVAAFETTMATQLLYTPGEFFTKDLSALIWIVTVYALAAALATCFVGRLGDQFGRRNVLIAVLIVSLVGSVISACAPSLTVLIAGRALQGVSGAILPLTIGIVRASFPAGRVALGVAVVSTSALVAGASGSLVGGVLLDHATWHWIFWSAAILAGVSAFLACTMIRRDPPETLASAKGIDWFGGILFGGGIAATLYGATTSKDLGWNSTQVLVFIVIGVAALVLWYQWERRIADPMIDLAMFADRKFSLGMVATALIALGPIGMGTVLSITLYRTPNVINSPSGDISLPVGLGYSATMAGVLGFLTAAASFAIAPLIGRISQNYGARTGLMAGSGLVIVGFGIVSFAPTDPVVVIAGLLLSVFGNGFLYAGMPTVIVECVTPEHTSTATGINAVVRTTFQAVAASLVAILLTVSPIILGDNSFTSRTGLNLVVGVCIAACLLTMVVVSRIPAQQPPHAQGEPSAAPSPALDEEIR